MIEVYSLFLFDLFCVLVLVKTFASDTLYLILVIYFSFLRALYHPWKQLRVKSQRSNIRQLRREVTAKEKKRTHVPSQFADCSISPLPEVLDLLLFFQNTIHFFGRVFTAVNR